MRRNRTNRVGRFVTDNRRVLAFLLLPVLGCVLGMAVQRAGGSAAPWAAWLSIQPPAGGFVGALSAWVSSCFHLLLLLSVVFVAGLSACGAPLGLVVPLFWGMGLGMTLANCYSAGFAGVAVAAVVLLPHSAMEGVALLMGASECLRMSLRFTVQLLPRSAHCGGLWQDFRLYIVRFLLLLLLLLGAGALDVGMRLLCAGWL